MLDYIRTFYIDRFYGPAYVVTNIVCIAAIVLLLGDVERSWKGAAKKLAEIALWWLAALVYASVYYALLGSGGLDSTLVILAVAAFAVFRSRYRRDTRVVLSFAFLAFWFMALPISEPIGDAIKSYINAGYTWGEHLTSVVMVILTVMVILFLRRFSTEKLTIVPNFPKYLVILISALCALLGILSPEFEMDTGFRVIMAVSFFLVELASYYMFYMVSREFEQNLELVAVQRKEELEQELMRFSRDNYEEMHRIRHEIKNHLSYIQFLAENGECDKIKTYLNTVFGETRQLFQFIECGNDVINAVMNHAVSQAKSRGVAVDATIVVPPSLPYQEVKLCSLLSNLMDNAIEAAAQSGREDPVVRVQIRPLQDYLFLRVVNPVRDDLPAQRILSLRTTKKDRRSHGYGTKVIRSVAALYQGTAKFDVKDGSFIADVMLYLEEGEDGTNTAGDL